MPLNSISLAIKELGMDKMLAEGSEYTNVINRTKNETTAHKQTTDSLKV
jgi:hypothetical protein